MKHATLCEDEMKGIKHIEVSNRAVKFRFDLVRNITLVRGDSGTGKTTLYAMIADYMRSGDKSGVNLSSPCPCIAVDDLLWAERISEAKESIVFIDEDSARFLRTREFASIVKNSDNYYVIFTREDLHELPYSVDEIYEIKTSGKYHSFKKLYAGQTKTRCFPDKVKLSTADTVITEDSKAGFSFFREVFSENETKVLAAGSNSGIYRFLKSTAEENTLVIADGAAFGAEIDRVLKLIATKKNIMLYLPESFEWMILRSGLVEQTDEILESPSEHIESREYFSWERFFTALLSEKTAGTYLAYSKDKLNENYLHDREKAAIIAVMPKNGFFS